MWEKLGGRKFIALMCSVVAYVVAVVGIWTLPEAPRYQSLITAAAILTGGASLYILGNAARSFADRPQIVQPPQPTVQVDRVDIDQSTEEDV